ncbi:histone deacetylase [Streptomyces sp. V4-01]|uniref:Histone deacetylase n=1 Tax=Actinacidiphila polyblastidii TaxID=3110430 RepID=A0ABU7P5T8_9ACTN|nr:histone deacetylase [Streptomyces sp. V4-01]
MPARDTAVALPGAVYFATHSPVWGGGRAFYDPDAPGVVWGRAYLVTSGQLRDIAAQEMYARPPGRRPDGADRPDPHGGALDLGAAVRSGRLRLGPGRYETLVCPGRWEGVPLLTLTAPWGVEDVAHTAPSPPYLRQIARGLYEAGRLSAPEIARYLASRPGAAGHWTPAQVLALLDPAGDPAADQAADQAADPAADPAGGPESR